MAVLEKTAAICACRRILLRYDASTRDVESVVVTMSALYAVRWWYHSCCGRSVLACLIDVIGRWLGKRAVPLFYVVIAGDVI